MNISVISKPFSTVAFGTYFNNVTDKDGVLIYRGDTCLCREDLDFPEVINYLDKKYKNVPKVNIVMHACSDGEEVYSFLGVLISHLKENAAKFLPVTAKDINVEHLKLAKRGVYNITKSEYKKTNDEMKGKFFDFFEPILSKGSKDPRLKYTSTVKVEHSLKKLVKFEQGNILEDVRKMDLKNTVLFARNFWPYLPNEKINELINIISRRADNSFTIIIGDYDTGVGDLLRQNGFTEVSENVFEKVKTECYRDYNINCKNLSVRKCI